MAVAPSPPPTRGSGVEDGSRKLLLDDLVAPEVARPPLHLDPISLDAVPQHRGRRRIEDVEEALGRNLRSAEEARRAVATQHDRLVAEAGIRRKLERELSALRRDIERMQESERLRVAQARYGAEREARKEVRAEVDQAVEEHNRALSEIDRLRKALDGDRGLMAELTERLRDEQHARMKAQQDADAAMDARRQIEQRLEASSDSARRRADEDLKRFAESEAALRAALAERDDLAAALATATEEARGRDLSDTVADLEHLVAELEANLTAERARTDNAIAQTAELTDQLEVARVQHRESLRSVAHVEQLEAELEGAVVAHGAAIDRVRVLDEECSHLTEELDEARTAQHTHEQQAAEVRRELTDTVRERDELTRQVTALRTSNTELTAKPASSDKVRELERLLDIAEAEHDALIQEVSDLRSERAARPQEVDEAAIAKVHEVEAALAETRAANTTFARRVQQLEEEVAALSDDRGHAASAITELERALSQERSRVREAEEELRRLHDSASVDAHAGTTGRAEPEHTAPDAPDAAPAVAAAPEPVEPEPAAPKVARRSAMAEFAGIASLDEGFRRR